MFAFSCSKGYSRRGIARKKATTRAYNTQKYKMNQKDLVLQSLQRTKYHNEGGISHTKPTTIETTDGYAVVRCWPNLVNDSNNSALCFRKTWSFRFFIRLCCGTRGFVLEIRHSSLTKCHRVCENLSKWAFVIQNLKNMHHIQQHPRNDFLSSFLLVTELMTMQDWNIYYQFRPFLCLPRIWKKSFWKNILQNLLLFKKVMHNSINKNAMTHHCFMYQNTNIIEERLF